MKALVLTEERTLALSERAAPSVTRPDDVIVRIRQTGVCGTDRSVLVGKFPAATGVVLGHEAVGVVEAVGPGATDLRPGDRVVANPTLYCGSCDACLRGRLNHCTRKTGNEVGIDRDGSYAEYLVLPEAFWHRIPDEISDDKAVLVEPLACVLSNVDAARMTPGTPVTVLGGGPIGLLFALVTTYLGSPTALVEKDPFRRGFAEDLLGSGRNAPARVVGAADPRAAAAPVVVDTVGSMLEIALDLVAVGGTVVVMGYDSRATSKVTPLDLLMRGITIVGAGDYNSHIFPRALDLARFLPLERLVTHRFALDRFDEALAALAGTGGGYAAQKVVIESRLEGAR